MCRALELEEDMQSQRMRTKSRPGTSREEVQVDVLAAASIYFADTPVWMCKIPGKPGIKNRNYYRRGLGPLVGGGTPVAKVLAVP